MHWIRVMIVWKICKCFLIYCASRVEPLVDISYIGKFDEVYTWVYIIDAKMLLNVDPGPSYGQEWLLWWGVYIPKSHSGLPITNFFHGYAFLLFSFFFLEFLVLCFFSCKLNNIYAFLLMFFSCLIAVEANKGQW